MEKKTISIWAVYLIGLVIVCGSAIGGYFIGACQSSGEIDRLNRKYDTLDREYTDRQQQAVKGIDRCIEIAGRTETNSAGAISNLKTAIEFIKQGIEENKALKSELNSIRTSLLEPRSSDRVPSEID